jgi:hypothetical protein
VDEFCRAPAADTTVACVDAPPIPPGDRDGDGKTDDIDNCPDIPNADQANEDMDQFGDLCDPCPPFTGVDNDDDDGDGVGNGCDPSPTVPGDSILVFEGFNSATAPASAMVTGNWIFMAGQARLSDSTVGGPVSQIVWQVSLPGNESVLARLELSNVLASGSAGVIDQLVTADGFACQAGLDAALAQRLTIQDGAGVVLANQVATDITGDPFLIDERRIGMEVRCTASAIAPTRAMTNSTTPPSPTPLVGIWAHDAAAQYDWVMIVRSP